MKTRMVVTSLVLACFLGCSSEDPKKAVDEKKDALPSFSETFTKIEKEAGVVTSELDAKALGEKAHVALHALDPAVKTLGKIIGEFKLEEADKTEITSATDALKSTFGAIDEFMHDGGEEFDYEGSSKTITDALAVLNSKASLFGEDKTEE